MQNLQKGIVNIQVRINDILENISINDITTAKVHDKCCTYIITAQSDKLYIGASSLPRIRMSQHKSGVNGTFMTKYHNNDVETIKCVSFYYTDTYEDAIILEHCLIKRLNPELNKRNKHNRNQWRIDNVEKTQNNVVLTPVKAEEMQIKGE